MSWHHYSAQMCPSKQQLLIAANRAIGEELSAAKYGLLVLLLAGSLGQ